MTCEKPCNLCPCVPTTPELHRGILRSVYDTIKASGGFPCHDRHPQAHALTKEAIGNNGLFHTTDCVGYKHFGLAPRAQEKNA